MANAQTLLPACKFEAFNTELVCEDRYAIFTENHIESGSIRRWHDTIDNLPRCHPTKGPWIAGGSVRRLLNEDNPFTADIDYFVTDKQQHHLLCARFETMDANLVIDGKHFTQYALPSLDLTCQVIKTRYRNTIYEHMDEFDFNLCQTGFDGEKFWVSVNAWKDMTTKTVNCTGAFHYPLGSLTRLAKYFAQGYEPGPNTLRHILIACNNGKIPNEKTYGEDT